jgi:hypothetical protein
VKKLVAKDTKALEADLGRQSQEDASIKAHKTTNWEHINHEFREVARVTGNQMQPHPSVESQDSRNTSELGRVIWAIP